ncbi:MAG: HEAT repeat domain-containing protein, partial [Nitrospira sp.]
MMSGNVVGAVLVGMLVWLVGPQAGGADAGTEHPGPSMLVSMPYESPPKVEAAPVGTVPPLAQALGPEDVKRAEALLPLLEGKQEFRAIGEFVHLGPGATPVLAKALAMPSPRVRYNAIETMLMIQDPGAVPSLIETAKSATEIPRVREHALRVSVRLDPPKAPPAIEALAKDPEPALRKAAAFEARYVREKAVIPVLITLVSDEEKSVAVTAINSLWILTRHESEMHDWETSTLADRTEWAQEWIDWWKTVQDTLQLPEPWTPRKP